MILISSFIYSIFIKYNFFKKNFTYFFVILIFYCLYSSSGNLAFKRGSLQKDDIANIKRFPLKEQAFPVSDVLNLHLNNLNYSSDRFSVPGFDRSQNDLIYRESFFSKFYFKKLSIK